MHKTLEPCGTLFQELLHLFYLGRKGLAICPPSTFSWFCVFSWFCILIPAPEDAHLRFFLNMRARVAGRNPRTVRRLPQDAGAPLPNLSFFTAFNFYSFLTLHNFSTGFILLEWNISSLEQFSLGDADLHLNPLPPLVPAWQLFRVLCFRWFEKTSSNFPYRCPS